MLYDRILKLCKLSQLHRSTQDVIHEEKVPDIGYERVDNRYTFSFFFEIRYRYYIISVMSFDRTLGLTFMKLLQPKRPLRPRRKGRKRIPVKGLTGQEVKVKIHEI